MTTTSSSTSSTSANAAAAAAAAQRAAEAARRAAEARRQAQAAQAQAARAQRAQQAAMEKRKAVTSTQSTLDRSTTLKPSQRVELQSRLEGQKTQWRDARETALTETSKAQAMIQRAQTTALDGQKKVSSTSCIPADRFASVNETNRQSFDKLFGPSAGSNQTAIPGLAKIGARAARSQEELSASQALASYKQLSTAAGRPADWSTQQAADFNEQLATLSERHAADPTYQKSLMTLAAPQLTRSAELLAQAADDDEAGEEVEALAGSLSRLGNSLPEEAAAQLAYGIAKPFPNHEELRQVDDGFGHFIDNGGSSKFRDLFVGALASQDKGDAAEEMIEGDPGLIDSVGERFEDVGEFVGETASDVFNTLKDAAGDAFNFLGGQLNTLGDAVRHEAANLIDVDGRIADLDAPGDAFTAHLDVEGNVLGANATVGVEMKVTRTEDGYTMDLTGKGSLGVAEKLGIPGLADAGVSASVTGEAAVSFNFANAAQVTQGAETVAGIGIGSALGGPLGAAVTGGSATEEIGNLASHFGSAKVMLGLEGSAGAELGTKLGLDAKIEGTASAQVGVEINAAGDLSLLLDQKVSLSGSVGGDLPLPKGFNLNAAATGTGEVELLTRVPLDLDLGELTSDPLGAIEDLGTEAINGATTTLSGKVNFAAGEGVEVALSATGKTRDLVGAIGQAFSGDLGGALDKLGRRVELEGSLRQYDERSTEISGGVHVPILGGVEINGGVASTSSDYYRHFEGKAFRASQLFQAIDVR